MDLGDRKAENSALDQAIPYMNDDLIQRIAKAIDYPAHSKLVRLIAYQKLTVDVCLDIFLLLKQRVFGFLYSCYVDTYIGNKILERRSFLPTSIRARILKPLEGKADKMVLFITFQPIGLLSAQIHHFLAD